MISYPCPTPCPNYEEGVEDPRTQMTQCARCGMWFLSPPDPDDKEGDA